MPVDTPEIEDDYDRRALVAVRKAVAEGPSAADRFTGRVGGIVGSIGRKANGALPTAVSDGAEQAMTKALSGLRSLTLDPALRSVRTNRVLQAYGRAGVPVTALDDIRSIPLRTIDSVTPGLSLRYALGAAVEGAGAGLAITGGEVLATGGSVAGAGAGAAPGIGTVVGAMAFDAATVLAASARVTAHFGAYHGYDTRLPDEQVFAMAVLNWSSAPSESAKVLAFQQLSRITQQLVRSAPWAQLSEHVLVKVVQELYARLGIRLTQRKLGQAIPVAGIVLGAGMNASILRSTAQDAHLAYRARHLSEKYGITLDEAGQPEAGAEPASAEVIDVEEIIDSTMRELRPPTDPDPE